VLLLRRNSIVDGAGAAAAVSVGRGAAGMRRGGRRRGGRRRGRKVSFSSSKDSPPPSGPLPAGAPVAPRRRRRQPGWPAPRAPESGPARSEIAAIVVGGAMTTQFDSLPGGRRLRAGRGNLHSHLRGRRAADLAARRASLDPSQPYPAHQRAACGGATRHRCDLITARPQSISNSNSAAAPCQPSSCAAARTPGHRVGDATRLPSAPGRPRRPRPCTLLDQGPAQRAVGALRSTRAPADASALRVSRLTSPPTLLCRAALFGSRPHRSISSEHSPE
jgi:hypothetical protein